MSIFLQENNGEMEMADKEKCFEAQIYFAFKVMDYTNNAFHAFETKALESIEYYMLKCLETYEEIQTAVAGDKLSKAYKSLLEGLNVLLKIHPFGTIDYYRNDFSRLKKILPDGGYSVTNTEKGQDRNYLDISIYMSIQSLYKKYMDAPIFHQYSNIILNTETFKVIDDIIEFFISDLLYGGFSFYFIKNWFSENYAQNKDFFTALTEKNISNFIEKIKEFDKNKQVFQVGIKYTLRHENKVELYDFLRKKFSLSNEKTQEQISQSGNWGSNKTLFYVFQTIEALDIYKAIELAEHKFDAAVTIFYTVQLPTTMKVTKDKMCIAGSNILAEYNTAVLKRATDMLWVDGKERDQLITYMKLSLSATCEMDTIGRVITSIKNAKELDEQNQFLNSWSALEYLLYAYPRNSIIEKVREIIPKSSALYCIKEKLNYFWIRLCYFCSNTKNADCENTIRLCNECKKVGIDHEYNTKKLLLFFADEEWEAMVLGELSRNIVLKRQLMELDGILKKSDQRHKLIKRQKEKIEADLNLIYRLRNQLVHSSASSDGMLEYVEFRLFRYVNSLLATILYYKSKNNKTTIAEILNSINCTYEWYLDFVKAEIKDDQYFDVVRPSYLFLD